MAISGLVGAGAQEALMELLTQRRLQEQLQQQEEQARVQQELQRQQLAQQAARDAARREREGKLDRENSHAVGVRRMIGELIRRDGLTPETRQQAIGLTAEAGDPLPVSLLQEPQKTEPRRHLITSIGKRGEPVRRLVSEDDPSLAEGIPEYREPKQPVAPRDERLVQIMGPQGAPIWVRESEAVGKPAAQAARAVTGAERQALAYFNRAKEAIDTITNPGDAKVALEDRVAKAGVMTQIGLQYAPNMLQSSDQQAYRQAQRAFTEARLRKESGAAIPAQEYENDARTYFAQPGDRPEVIEQKRKARLTVLDGLKFSAGKAYNEFYGDEDEPLSVPKVGKSDLVWDGTKFVRPGGGD